MSPAATNATPLSDSPLHTVLVVEGEVLIRLVVADYLRECGYKVHEAVNAQ